MPSPGILLPSSSLLSTYIQAPVRFSCHRAIGFHTPLQTGPLRERNSPATSARNSYPPAAFAPLQRCPLLAPCPLVPLLARYTHSSLGSRGSASEDFLSPAWRCSLPPAGLRMPDHWLQLGLRETWDPMVAKSEASLALGSWWWKGFFS